MRTNYHTHTTRCLHATGSDEEFVLSAIKGGYQELGFSDHTPWKYHTNYISDIRMTPEELPDYAGLTTCRVIDYIPEWRRKEAETAPQKRPQAPAQKEAPHRSKPPVNEKQLDRSEQPPAYDLAEDDEIGMVECTVESICGL